MFSVKYIGVSMGNNRIKNIKKKINLFQHIFGKIKRTFVNKVRKETIRCRFELYTI